jgi:hypothetical protein
MSDEVESDEAQSDRWWWWVWPPKNWWLAFRYGYSSKESDKPLVWRDPPPPPNIGHG